MVFECWKDFGGVEMFSKFHQLELLERTDGAATIPLQLYTTICTNILLRPAGRR